MIWIKPQTAMAAGSRYLGHQRTVAKLPAKCSNLTGEAAEVLGADGKIVAALRGTVPVRTIDGVTAAAGSHQAFGTTAVDLVSWAAALF